VTETASRGFAEWMSEFPGASQCIGEMEDFCPRFAALWNRFRDNFGSFLENRYGAGLPTASLSELLSDFHRDNPGYLLKGCVVNGPMFDEMVKIARDIDLQYIAPYLWTDAALNPAKLRALSHGAFERYMETCAIRGFYLCGKSDLVWAMDLNDVGAFAPDYPNSLSDSQASEAVEKLGLVDLAMVTRVIIFEYERGIGAEPVPRTPTPIDGLSHELFEVVRPCTRQGGWTRTTGGAVGLREAVHGCALVLPSGLVTGKVGHA